MKRSHTQAAARFLLLLLVCGAAQTIAPAQRSRSGERMASSFTSNETEKAELEAALALPPSERIEKLKAFVESHPRSTLKTRATELIISARAALGDQKLQAGDAPGGIEQFRAAITESPASMTDKLFTEVVAQIPANLFVRGERAASLEAARMVEAKAGSDARRLLAMAAFYLRIEEPDEAARVAEASIKLAPEMAEAHQALGAARHIALRLDDAIAEYRRALELNPKAAGVRRSLADLYRAQGKAEEALALYREELAGNQNERGARAGLILSLFDLGRREEAESELDAALKADPNNLALLAGASYWYAAHKENGRALELARRALALEPRYTWAQIAMARALVAARQPLEAESALRFARQYGRFPTLDYEFASALAAAGLYDEAAEQLARSFTIRDGQIETQLAGRTRQRAATFIELLAPERRASIFQNTPADDAGNARMLKGLLALAAATETAGGGAASNREAEALAAAQEFTAGEDPMRAYRQLYTASRLLRSGTGLPMVLELTEQATGGVEAALDLPVAPVAIQAEEMRPVYARAVATGAALGTSSAPRNVLSNILRGRIEDLRGWALFNQNKTAEAVTHLRRAASVMPENTPWWRIAQWHLGAALEADGNRQEALAAYIKSYRAGGPDPTRRVVIEALYRKINGSLEGLDERIGASPSVPEIASSSTSATPAPLPETPAPFASSPETVSPAAGVAAETGASEAQTKTSETVAPAKTETAAPTSSAETGAAAAAAAAAPAATGAEIPSPSPAATPEPTRTPGTTPTVEQTPAPTPEQTPASIPAPTAEPSPTATPEPSPTTTTPTVSVPVTASTPEPTPEPSPEQTATATPPAATASEPSPQPTPQPTREATPEATPAPTTEATTEATPEPSPTPTPGPPPDATSEVTPTPEPGPTPGPTQTPETAPNPQQQPATPPSTPRRDDSNPDKGECIITLSEDSLTIRPNGSATVTVTLSDLSRAAGIQPVSSDWANLAVFPEPAEGDSFKYTITSISKMTGTYYISFKSPCGLKNLTVNVK